MNRSLSRGFSLVELMIALVLGLVVTLAATQMFNINQRSFQLQQAMADIQEQGQLTLRFIANDIRMTGFFDPDTAGDVGVVVSGGMASANGASGASDRLTIAYHGREDCEGGTSVDLTQVINSYWVSDGALRCNGNLSAASGVALIDNVESFQVLYGLRAAGLPPRVEQYVTAGSIGANDQVIAIKVAFMLSNDEVYLGPETASQSVVLLDEKIDTPEDGAMRRLFYRTVAIRNFEWDET